MNRIAIIGLGLIGGSLAKTIKLHTDAVVYGEDINPQAIQQALLLGALHHRLAHHAVEHMRERCQRLDLHAPYYSALHT